MREAREEDTEDTGSSREGKSRKDHIVIGGGIPEFHITVRKMHKAANVPDGDRRYPARSSEADAYKHLSPKGTSFHGITVVFDSPVILSGTKNHYFLTGETLTKLEDSTYRVIAPFYEAGAEGSAPGHSEFAIGVNNISEFYYRIMPELLRNPFITVTEEDEDEINSNLPPEAKFDFYLDTDKDELFCKPFVTYGDTSFDLTSGEPAVLPHGKGAGLDAEENGKKEDAGKKADRKKQKEQEAAEREAHKDDLRGADLPDSEYAEQGQALKGTSDGVLKGTSKGADLSKEMIANARRTMHDKH